MLTIFLIAICLCFIAEMLLVGINVFGIIACIIVALLVVLGLMKKRAKWMTAIGMLLLVGCVIGGASLKRDSYTFNYEKSIEQAQEYILEGEVDEAFELLDTVERAYGQTEETIKTRVLCHMANEDYDKAIPVMETYPNRKSKEYYSLMESIYELQGEEGQQKLYELHLEAANEHPSWLEMQMSAGTEKLKEKNYASAQYFFKRAYYLAYEDGMPAYMLGLTSYYKGDYKNCLMFYNEALEKGVSDEVKKAILAQVSIVQGEE